MTFRYATPFPLYIFIPNCQALHKYSCPLYLMWFSVLSLQNLHNFLCHPNCLETLDLSNSDCSLELVKPAQIATYELRHPFIEFLLEFCGHIIHALIYIYDFALFYFIYCSLFCVFFQVCASLCRGSLKHLAILNMSRTVFSHRSDSQYTL